MNEMYLSLLLALFVRYDPSITKLLANIFLELKNATPPKIENLPVHMLPTNWITILANAADGEDVFDEALNDFIYDLKEMRK